VCWYISNIPYLGTSPHSASRQVEAYLAIIDIDGLEGPS
jgi:hypothetical protein